MIIEYQPAGGRKLRVRVLEAETPGAICMKKDTALRLTLTVPSGSPPGTAEMFLRGWTEIGAWNRWSRGKAEERKKKRKELEQARLALENFLNSEFSGLQSSMGIRGIAWNTRCPDRVWAVFRYDTCTVSFHPALGKYPAEVIREVAVHELLHVRHREHDRQFWEELTQWVPKWPYLEGVLRCGQLS